MEIEEVKRRLTAAGCEIKSEEELPNNSGVQLRLASGAIVNIYNTGKVLVQGRNTDEVERCLELGRAEPAGERAASNKVFVVYGHDATARDQLEAMLRRWGLDPLILDQLPSEGQTIIEKLEKYTGKV